VTLGKACDYVAQAAKAAAARPPRPWRARRKLRRMSRLSGAPSGSALQVAGGGTQQAIKTPAAGSIRHLHSRAVPEQALWRGAAARGTGALAAPRK
jgi:hypothetical protein